MAQRSDPKFNPAGDDPNADIVKKADKSKRKTKGKKVNPQSIDVFRTLLFTNAALNPREFFKFRQQDKKEDEKRQTETAGIGKAKGSLKDRVALEMKADKGVNRNIASGEYDDDNDFDDEVDREQPLNGDRPDFSHQANGLDHMFALVQRNPVIMHPPRSRFIARAALSNAYNSGAEVMVTKRPQTEKTMRLSGQKRSVRDDEDYLRSETIAAMAVDNDEQLESTDAPKSSHQSLIDRKAEQEAGVRDILSLLDQRLAATRSSDAGKRKVSTTVTPAATSTSAVSNNNDERAIFTQVQEHVDMLSRKMTDDTSTTRTTNVASAAVYHHRQLDAYLGSLYEFNHQVFTSLTLNDLLFQLGKLGRDAAAHMTNFTEVVIGQRAGALAQNEQAENLKRMLDAAKELGEDDYRQSQIHLEEQKHKSLLAALYPEQHQRQQPQAGASIQKNTSVKNEFDYEEMMAMAYENPYEAEEEQMMMNDNSTHNDADATDFMMQMMMGMGAEGATRRTLTFAVDGGTETSEQTVDTMQTSGTTQLAPFSDDTIEQQ